MTTVKLDEATNEDVHRLIETAIGLGDKVEELQIQLQEKLGIANVVGGLETRTDKIEELNKKQKRWTRLVGVGLILDLLLSFGLSGMFLKVNGNSNSIKGVQNVISKEVLCPVYGLVLSAGYHPERHMDDLAAYKAAWKVFQDGNRKLNCPEPKV